MNSSGKIRGLKTGLTALRVVPGQVLSRGPIQSKEEQD